MFLFQRPCHFACIGYLQIYEAMHCDQLNRQPLIAPYDLHTPAAFLNRICRKQLQPPQHRVLLKVS